MSNYILLFIEFFKTGIFTFGGGLASLPFLYNMIDSYSWFTNTQLTQLIAVSNLTPGPIGLNMATFAGYNTSGFLGSIIASIALIIPMFIITSIVFKIYKKFKENKYVKAILYVLRPTSCALLCAVGLKLFKGLIIIPKDYIGFILLIILFIMTLKLPRNPIIYIGFSALFGVIVYFIRI